MSLKVYMYILYQYGISYTFLAVMSNGPSDRLSPLGCYSLQYPQELHGTHIHIDEEDLLDRCINFYCDTFDYAGMQDNYCFCTNIPPHDTLKLDDDECHTRCKNDSDMTCGGWEAMSVYAIVYWKCTTGSCESV